MNVKTSVKGGKLSANHNQSQRPVPGLPVRTAVKGGRLAGNHNQTLIRPAN